MKNLSALLFLVASLFTACRDDFQLEEDPFTNVTGGGGILSSRSVDLVQGINLAAGDARDSLRSSIYTRTLGFQ